jgi:hypothetical protein
MSDQPGTDGGKRGLVFIPIRGAIGAMIPLVREAMGRLYGDNPRTWQALAKEVLGTFSPVDPDAAYGLGSFVPPLPKLAMELQANHDFFRDQPIVPPSMEGLPPTEQVGPQTSQTARALARSNIPGFSGKSPLGIDYAIRGFSPGPGEALLGLGDLFLRATGQALPEPARKGPPGARDLPLLGGIAGRFLRTAGEEQRTVAYQNAQDIADQSRRGILDAVQASPAYQKSTPDRRTQMLRDLETALVNQARQVAGAQPTERELGLPPKYIGVKDPARQRAIDTAVSAYRAWVADPSNNLKPTSAQLKLALAYEDLINPKYTEELKRQRRETAQIQKRVQQAVPAP